MKPLESGLKIKANRYFWKTLRNLILLQIALEHYDNSPAGHFIWYLATVCIILNMEGMSWVNSELCPPPQFWWLQPTIKPLLPFHHPTAVSNKVYVCLFALSLQYVYSGYIFHIYFNVVPELTTNQACMLSNKRTERKWFHSLLANET